MVIQGKRIVWCVLIVMVMGGCTPATENEPALQGGDTASTAPVQSGYRDGQENVDTGSDWIEVPRNLRFQGQVNTAHSSSWNARLAELSMRDRDYLSDMNDKYYGSLEFDSAAEQQRLATQGFPTPEEWLAVRDIPDIELERLAKTGNTKARMFQVDRVSDRVAPVLAERGLRNTPEDKELFRLLTDAMQMAESLLRETRSPFSAYLAGRIFSAGSQGNRPEPLVAAFLLAQDFGDSRADGFRIHFMTMHPGMDAESITAYYGSFDETANRTRQAPGP